MGGDNLIKVVRAFLYFSGMPITIPKSLLLVPKIPSIAVVGLLAAQFLILQSIFLLAFVIYLVLILTNLNKIP